MCLVINCQMSTELSWFLVQVLFVCLFVFILWHLPRNKIVVFNKLQNQEIGEVIREMWETEKQHREQEM